MNYWVICLPKADLEHCIRIETFGLNRKQLISSVREHDKIVCCAGKGDWKIIALGEATTDYYNDDSAVFLKPGLFIDRIGFRAYVLSKEIQLLPIIGQLTFITNPSHWAVYFRNGIAKMSKEDWNLIQQCSGDASALQTRKSTDM